MTKTLEMETEAEEAPQAIEPAKFEIVQADLFENYIKRENRTRDLAFAEATPFEVWEAYTRGILELTRRSMRDVGMCLIFGERAYGEKYSQVIDAMRYTPKTLQNAVLVVGNVKNWHDNLSFAHHDIVSSLTPAQQEKLLAQAEEEHLTTAKLRKLRNELYPPKKKGGGKKKESAPKVDVTDEGEILEAANLVIAFLEKAEVDEPFRKWPKERMAKWAPILGSILKIARRSIIKTHSVKRTVNE